MPNIVVPNLPCMCEYYLKRVNLYFIAINTFVNSENCFNFNITRWYAARFNIQYF